MDEAEYTISFSRHGLESLKKRGNITADELYVLSLAKEMIDKAIYGLEVSYHEAGKQSLRISKLPVKDNTEMHVKNAKENYETYLKLNDELSKPLPWPEQLVGKNQKKDSLLNKLKSNIPFTTGLGLLFLSSLFSACLLRRRRKRSQSNSQESYNSFEKVKKFFKKDIIQVPRITEDNNGKLDSNNYNQIADLAVTQDVKDAFYDSAVITASQFHLDLKVRDPEVQDALDKAVAIQENAGILKGVAKDGIVDTVTEMVKDKAKR